MDDQPTQKHISEEETDNPSFLSKYRYFILGVSILFLGLAIGVALDFSGDEDKSTSTTQPDERVGHVDLPEKEDQIVEQDEVDSTSSHFVSPKSGDVVQLGSTMEIKWKQDVIEAVSISLIPVSEHIEMSGLQIYQISDLDDPVYVDGVYTYELPDYLHLLYPGRYKVQVSNYKKQRSIESPVFTIESPVPILEPESGELSITTSSVRKGDNVYFLTIEAREGDNSLATDGEGYSASLRWYDDDGNTATDWTITGSYLFGDSVWQFVIPSYIYNNAQKVEATIWCSDFRYSSSCAQRYGNRRSAQAEKMIDLSDL